MKLLKQKGFTLTELMIVMAIIGIIASIAIPSYTDYVKKGMAAEATAILADTRIKLEQCFQDTRAYNNAACTAISAPSGQNFAFTFTSNADTYTLTATGSGKVSGFSYTVDESNNKTSVYDGVSGNCWKTSKASSC